MVRSERLCFYGVFHPCSLESRFLRPEYCWNCFARVSSSIKNSACFCYWINRKDMSCHESKISFLSMCDKLKLKNDATYEGIKWDFLRNFCSSLKNNKLFSCANTHHLKKNQHRTLPHDGFWLLLGQKSSYKKCDQTKMGARSSCPI